MEFVDQEKTCRDCGGSFTFTAGEASFFAGKGLNPPSRCKQCRSQRKASAPQTNTPVEVSATPTYEAVAPLDTGRKPKRGTSRYQDDEGFRPRRQERKPRRGRRYEEDDDDYGF